MANIIDRIPGMTDEDILVLFQNAINKLSDTRMHEAAANTLSAIEREWQSRSLHSRARTERYESPTTGMLANLGYHVGSTNGQTAAVRRRILKHVLERQLPLVSSFRYTDEWGPPNSPKRYSKLSQFLANQLTNPANRAKTRAIMEWSEDLDWMQQNYQHLAR